MVGQQQKISHFRLPKTALNGNFFTFLSYWKVPNFHFVPEDIYEKRIILNKCVKNHFTLFLMKP